jgi:hypothetical protein
MLSGFAPSWPSVFCFPRKPDKPETMIGVRIEDVLNRPCSDFRVRRSRRIASRVFEWQYAEDTAFFYFRNYFEALYRGGLVINQANYLRVDSEDRQIRFVLNALSVYLRNWWSKANPKREGGARKPDGLGISPGGRVIEVVEVKPADMRHEAEIQLNEVIGKIRDGLEAYYEERSIERGISLPFDPKAIVVKGSSWRPKGNELVIPLKSPDSVTENAWICFKPSVRPSQSGTLPEEGVILYEIHVQ